MNFLETERAKELLTAVLSEHLAYVKSDLTNTEIEVMQQKGRIFKFYCWLRWNHIEKKGICLRCGKILTKPTKP